MPYTFMREILPALARAETRTIIVLPGSTSAGLPAGTYALSEMFCDEPRCDCRRVMLFVESSFRPGPEAVIAWGWESPTFYAEWMGGADAEMLRQMQGPILNLGSPETELADSLLGKVTHMLATDSDYTARIQEHYRRFRRHIAPQRRSAWFEPPKRTPCRRDRGTARE